MPLRPATFNPYPAQDRRTAARERYYRAMEEARRAKEAYEAVTKDEEKQPTKEVEVETEVEVEVEVVEDEPAPAPVPVMQAAMPTSPAMQPAHASFVALNPPPAASSSSRTITPAPPAPNSFEEWVRANMGVPSVFAPPEPAPEPEAAPSPPSDEEERERRRAALRVTELASSPELEPSSAVSSSKSSSPTTTPPSTAPAPAHAPKRTPLQQLADAAEQAPLPVPRPSASQKSSGAPAPAPAPPLAPAPTPAPAPPAILGPKPKSPSPTPQHIPLFTCPDLTAAASSSTPPDPLAEITMLASTFVAMRKSFTFPDRLDFSTLSAPPTPDGDVKLPVCARNLAVHAYEHALSKILGRLEGVGNVRARGVREKRKDAVKDVKDEMERVRKEVSRRARESWGR